MTSLIYASAELDSEQSLFTDKRLSQVTVLHSLQATASWPGTDNKTTADRVDNGDVIEKQKVQ